MSEADEIADGMRNLAPLDVTFKEAVEIVRRYMPEDSHTMIDNVAWSLYLNRRTDR